MDLSGKTCLITGANTGLGFSVAKKLAAKGAKTLLVCRSKQKGDQAISNIKSEIPEASTELLTCDLASLSSVKELIMGIKTNYKSLDILFNNAAVMKRKRIITDDGFEMMFQVNYLSALILMNSLLPLLKNSPSPMIINNGRPSYKLRIDLDDLQFEKRYSMYNSFFRTKLYLLFSTLELVKRPDGKGITTTMIDPGPFKSNLVRDMPLAGWFKNLFSAPVERAADNILFHIQSIKTDNKNGKVFKERLEWPLSDYWSKTNLGEELWSVTSSLLENDSFKLTPA